MAKTNPSPTFPMYPGDAAAVTLSDVDTFPPSVLFIGTTGALKVTTAQGSDITFNSLPGGTILPLQVIRVWSTGTVASNIIRIF